MAKNFHEHYDRPELPLPPDRSTGLVFTGIALVVAYVWRNDPTVLTVSLCVAGALAAVSLAVPIWLRPLNIVWMRLRPARTPLETPLETSKSNRLDTSSVEQSHPGASSCFHWSKSSPAI